MMEEGRKKGRKTSKGQHLATGRCMKGQPGNLNSTFSSHHIPGSVGVTW